MLKKWFRKNCGFSLVEILVSVVVIATFGVAMTGTILAGQDSTKRTDVTAFFDNRNMNASAVFKTNPSVDYVKDKEPFVGMDYDSDTKTFTQYFDKKLNIVPTGDPKAAYQSTYEIGITEKDTKGFKFENKEIRLNMKNLRKNDVDGQFELMENSSARGSVSVHANVLDEDKVIPSSSATDPTGPTNPGSPTEPTVPNAEYYYVEFVLSKGTFTDTGTNILTKRVKNGSRLGESIQVDESTKKPILPVEVDDFTPDPDVTSEFSGWKNKDGTLVSKEQVVNSNIKIIGDYVSETNKNINLEMAIHDRNFWDTSSAEIGFMTKNDSVYVTVQEKELNGIPAHEGAMREYPLPMTLSDLKKESNRNVTAVQSVYLKVTYNYVDVMAEIEKNKALELFYNGAVIPRLSKFDGTGPKLVSENMKTQIANALGMDPSLIALEVKFVRNTVEVKPATEKTKSAKYAIYLDLTKVGTVGRKENEKYTIKLVKQPVKKDRWGNDYIPYQVQLLGENGQNILHENLEGNRPWGETIHLTHLNFNIGGVLGQDLREIHQLTFLTTGFNIQFAEGVDGNGVPLLNAPGTELNVHNIRVITPDYGNIPQGGGGQSVGKGELQMYGSQGGGDMATTFNWVDPIYNWKYGWKDWYSETNTTGITDCPNDSATIDLPLPKGFTAKLK